MENKSVHKRFDGVEGSRTFCNMLDEYNLRSKKVLDIGCGYGEYLKHFGKGSFGITSTMEEVEFGKNNNLTIIKGNAEKMEDLKLQEKFEAIWANNLFEHLLSPHAFLVNLKTLSNDKTVLILGVPVIPKPYFLTRFRFWRGMLASNHINFFNHDSLKLTIERAGWKVLAGRPYIFKNCVLDELLTPFAPHLYFICENDASFVYPEKKVKEWEGEEYYKGLLKINNS